MIRQLPKSSSGLTRARPEQPAYPALPPLENIPWSDLQHASPVKATGILRHSTHLADLILAASLPSHQEGLDAFATLVTNLVESIKRGHFSFLSEKIDGSPAVMLGFTAQQQPFVAYKGGMARARGPQALITSAADASRWCTRNSEVLSIYQDCISLMGPALQSAGLHDYVFQADLLFTPRNGARRIESDRITIQANPSGLQYRIPATDPLYAQACSAPLGIVIHTVGKRHLDPASGKIEVIPCGEYPKIAELVSSLRANGIFAVHPWRFRVPARAGESQPTTSQLESEVAERLHSIRQRLSRLSPEFQTEWKRTSTKFATYLNFELYPPGRGGLYRAAAAGAAFDFRKFKQGFQRWLVMRQQGFNPASGESFKKEDPRLAKELFNPFLRRHGPELEVLMGAYYEANRIFYALKPFLKEALSSKLGGGPAEGFMLGQIKVVDRLAFTMLNFSTGRNRAFAQRFPVNGAALAQNTAAELPRPFEQWRAGAVFCLCKLQPLHAGHVAMLRAAKQQAGDAPFFVIASDKQPNLEAALWKAFGVTSTRRELQERSYTHVFSNELRMRLISQVPELEDCTFLTNPGFLWSYLARAKESGERGLANLVIGEKEALEQRYAEQLEAFSSHLQLLAIPEKKGGLSGTQVREAVRTAALSDTAEAWQTLHQALEYVNQKDRRTQLIRALIREWKRVDRIAQGLVAPPVSSRNSKPV